MMDKKELVERVARAWAAQDGKTELFDRCVTDPEMEEEYGHHGGYTAEAYDLLETAGVFKDYEGFSRPDVVAKLIEQGAVAKPHFGEILNIYSDEFAEIRRVIMDTALEAAASHIDVMGSHFLNEADQTKEGEFLVNVKDTFEKLAGLFASMSDAIRGAVCSVETR